MYRIFYFFFSSRRRHTRLTCDWSSDVCSSDLSDDPTVHPLIDPNYLGEASDMDKMVEAVRIAREIFATKAFAPWAGPELMPADDPRTDDQLRAFLRATADSYHHQV